MSHLRLRVTYDWQHGNLMTSAGAQATLRRRAAGAHFTITWLARVCAVQACIYNQFALACSLPGSLVVARDSSLCEPVNSVLRHTKACSNRPTGGHYLHLVVKVS